MEENEPNGIIQGIDWDPDMVERFRPPNISEKVILLHVKGAISVEKRFVEHREAEHSGNLNAIGAAVFVRHLI